MHKELRKGAKKGTIILLHGNSSSSKVFEPVFNSDIAYTLLAIDLPGHGESERAENYGYPQIREKLLDQVLKVEEPLILVGNSLGGHLAIEILNNITNSKGILIFGTPPLKRPLNL